MEQSFISIIFATLNEEEYIGRTLRTLKKVLNLCEVNAEIIVVDSSDNDLTFRIARGFTDKVFRFDEKGLAKARNYGASKARGDIIVYMDADSVPQGCIFRELLETFKEDDVVAAVSYVQTYDKKPNLAQKIFYAIDITFIKACRKIPFLLKFYNRGDFFAVKKDVLNKVGGFDEKLSVMEITDFIVRVQRIGKVAVLNKPVYESSRRLKSWGFLKSHTYWWKNYLSYYLLKKPLEKIYPIIR
ncbi:MAG: glycosyltransferase [Candidatus Bathyarchaeia archaeon]